MGQDPSLRYFAPLGLYVRRPLGVLPDGYAGNGEGVGGVIRGGVGGALNWSSEIREMPDKRDLPGLRSARFPV